MTLAERDFGPLLSTLSKKKGGWGTDWLSVMENIHTKLVLHLQLISFYLFVHFECGDEEERRIKRAFGKSVKRKKVAGSRGEGLVCCLQFKNSSKIFLGTLLNISKDIFYWIFIFIVEPPTQKYFENNRQHVALRDLELSFFIHASSR